MGEEDTKVEAPRRRARCRPAAAIAAAAKRPAANIPEEMVQPVRKRATRSKKTCTGRNDAEPCVFGGRTGGEPALVYGAAEKCVFCDGERMKTNILDAMERGRMVRKYKTFTEEVQSKAIEYVPQEFRVHFQRTAAQKKCQGLACIFSQNGEKIRARTNSKQVECFFCNANGLRAACEKPNAVRTIANKMQKLHKDAQQIVLAERLPKTLAAEIKRKMAAPPPKARRTQKRKAVDAEAVHGPYTLEEVVSMRQARRAAWHEKLQQRQPPRTDFTEQELATYRKRALDDRATSRKALGLREKVKRGRLIDNDTDLPPAKRTRLATDIDNWCRYNSWGLCKSCGCLNPRPMTPKLLDLEQVPEIPPRSCAYCSAQQDFPTPTPDDIPEPLRDLSTIVCEALSPLEMDCGPYECAKTKAGRDAGELLSYGSLH